MAGFETYSAKVVQFFLIWFAFYGVPTNGVKNLTIGAYVPLTGPCWGGGFAVKIVIELALSQVNSRTDILPGYQLNMVLNDTKVCAKKLSNVLCH